MLVRRLDLVLDDFLVRFGDALPVIDIPAEGIEERVDELPSNLRLVVVAGFVLVFVAVESFDELFDFFGWIHAIQGGPTETTNPQTLLPKKSVRVFERYGILV